MPSKSELAALAESQNGHALIPSQPLMGVHALAQMEEDDFQNRLTALKNAARRVAQVQREYMTEDIDFGTIPGTPKPTLFKSGAEKLAQLYGLTARIESNFTQGDGDTAPPLTYDSICHLHVGSFDGPEVAIGHGTANTWEKRYRRDTKVCPNCGQPKIIKSKYDPGWYCLNCKHKYGQNDPQITEQGEAPTDVKSAYDLAVTVMKMSEKRAFVDAVLRATATSGLFTQDVVEEAVEREDAGFAAPIAQQNRPIEERAAYSPSQAVSEASWPSRVPGIGAVAADHVDDAIQAAETTTKYGLTEEQFAAVSQQIGAEEVSITDSAIPNVARGGKTQGASTAQVEEVKRLAHELEWGAKALLGYSLNRLERDGEVPDDGRHARSDMSALLDSLSAEEIGTLIQGLAAELDLHQQAARITP